ncbi:hypothetical protein [Nocardiopsis alba]|uniref:hypothetical protein n=1 Tax=Nocardiopsis alba TaxID=53437 RepID=UPI003F4D3116
MRTIHASTTGLDTSVGFGEETLVDGYVDRRHELTDLVCDPDLCRPVVGNVLVFWDGGHITTTYMRTLAPELERRLLTATDW